MSSNEPSGRPPNDDPPEIDDALCAEAARACACFNFRKASRAVTQLFDEALAPVGLRSTQFVILVAIRVHGPVALADLSREMITDRTTLSRNLKPLEREGLIERQRAPRPRAHLMQLTDAGKRRLAEGIPLWERAQRRFVERMGRDRWEMILGTLAEAVEAAKEQ